MSTRVSQGYTILETMIFLAVTSALFVMVVITFQGRQASTEFSVATREMESRIKDIINDVDTGYYGGVESIQCDVIESQGRLDIKTVSGDRGSSGDCIFLGKAIQFGVTDSTKAYNVFSIAGAREVWRANPPRLVDNYDLSHATPIDSATQRMQYPTGLTFGGMHTTYGQKSTVAFLAPLNQFLGKRNSGSLNLEQVAALPAADGQKGKASRTTLDEAAGLIKDIGSSNGKLSWDKTVLGTPYVDLCLEGDRVEKHVIYRMGNIQRLGEVELIIGEGLCPGEFKA